MRGVVAVALFLVGATSAAAQDAVPATLGARANYAKQIERAFLSDGVDLTMMVLERPDKGDDPKRFPQLVFFGSFGKPLVYKTIAETPMLDVARKHGFRSVDFFSKIDGHWVYEVAGTGTLPRCDRMKRLCY